MANLLKKMYKTHVDIIKKVGHKKALFLVLLSHFIGFALAVQIPRIVGGTNNIIYYITITCWVAISLVIYHKYMYELIVTSKNKKGLL